jgi:transposase
MSPISAGLNPKHAAHQLCCAHAVRELRAAGEAAPTCNGWHWATQAADSLLAIQKLIIDAAGTETGATDSDALDVQIHAFRCAALIGAGRPAPAPVRS